MLPHINILSHIISNLDMKNIIKLSLCSHNTYDILLEKLEEIIAVRKISNWWMYHKIPLDVPVYNYYESCEYLINVTYKDSGCCIPNIENSLTAMVMLRKFRGQKYIHFNRKNNTLKYWNGFIIGKTDIHGNFYKLNREEFLLCLRRYEQCVDPKTNLIWRKKGQKQRKVIGRIDKNYNIFRFSIN